ncbi:MAG: ferritin-like domain-containing protein [Polyangiaceae bacterium]
MSAMIDLRDAAQAHRPELPDLPDLYESARETWLGRMVNEHTSAAVFEGLARQIRQAGLEDELAEECLEFAAEERRHGVLCAAVVEALGGEAIAPAPQRDPYPEHPDVTPTEALVRNLLSISCSSETVAVALIGAERLEMPDGELRELLTMIWADEIGHARFGWGLVARLVPTLDDAARGRLSAYLAVVLGHLEEHELAHLPVGQAPPAEGAALGLCSGRDARHLLYSTIDRVILPGLEALGLQARRAWRLRHRALDGIAWTARRGGGVSSPRAAL